MLLAWFVFGYVASTLFINKDLRYTMPYLPALGLLSAIGFVQIRQVIIRRVGLTLIILYALVQYAGLTIGLSDKVAGVPAYFGGQLGQMPFPIYTEATNLISPARAENWQLDPIFEMLLTDAKPHADLQRPIQLLVIPSAVPFDAQAFTYVVWRDRLPVEVSRVTGIVEVDSAHMLEDSDYVVTKSGVQGLPFAVQDADKITATLLDPTSTLRAEYALLGEFALPDGSSAQLFSHSHQ
jgi:hypothetical protein